ncbi:MAG: CopD family protein, partial [Burkholderiales bacterium]
MLWIKALHIAFMVTWFAGLFYLPRLFVYHALATDRAGAERFKVMERKLFFGIMTPGAVLTIAFGLWLWLGYGIGAGAGWLHAKLAVVVLLIGYHVWCGKLLLDFKRDRNTRSDVWY